MLPALSSTQPERRFATFHSSIEITIRCFVSTFCFDVEINKQVCSFQRRIAGPSGWSGSRPSAPPGLGRPAARRAPGVPARCAIPRTHPSSSVSTYASLFSFMCLCENVSICRASSPRFTGGGLARVGISARRGVRNLARTPLWRDAGNHRVGLQERLPSLHPVTEIAIFS